MRIYNGMPANELPIVGGWMKSQYSVSGNCVELAELAGDAGIAIRNSRDPEGPALVYTREEIEAFIRGVASGQFDGFAR